MGYGGGGGGGGAPVVLVDQVLLVDQVDPGIAV